MLPRRRVVKKCGVVIGALAVAASPAFAQTIVIDRNIQHRSADVMPAFEVASLVRSMDLTPVSPPRAAGDYYIVRALDWRGVPVRVVVDGRYRRVQEPGPVFAGRWSRRGRFGAVAPYYGERNPPSPPRSVRSYQPSASPAARQRSAAIDPEALPLPRPRPELAQDVPAPRAPAPNAATSAGDVTGSIARSVPVPVVPLDPPAVSGFPPPSPLE